MNALTDAIAAEQAAAAALAERRREVWAAVQAAHPQLAGRIRELFSDPDVAARWLCDAHGGRPSPAAQLATSEATQVEAQLIRALQGMGA